MAFLSQIFMTDPWKTINDLQIMKNFLSIFSNATIPVVLLLILTTVVMVVYPRKTLQEELQTQKQSQVSDRCILFLIAKSRFLTRDAGAWEQRGVKVSFFCCLLI